MMASDVRSLPTQAGGSARSGRPKRLPSPAKPKPRPRQFRVGTRTSPRRRDARGRAALLAGSSHGGSRAIARQALRRAVRRLPQPDARRRSARRSSKRRCSLADVGVDATAHLLDDLRDRYRRAGGEADPRALLRDRFRRSDRTLEAPVVIGAPRPFVIMLAGVNGAGKTTSIGKLAQMAAAAEAVGAAGGGRHVSGGRARAARRSGASATRVGHPAAGRRSGGGDVRCARRRQRARASTWCSPTPPAGCRRRRT